MDKFKIVADSSSDMSILKDIRFCSAPLKITTNNQEFIDDENLAVEDMVEFLSKYKGKTTTSCPNPQDWLDCFGDAQYVFCITITGKLSGSYNAANVAKKTYEKDYPDRKVFVLDSLSTGPQIRLIIEKINEMIVEGMQYEEICKSIKQYAKQTGLVFMLESMKNLANNGRVLPIIAKAVGMLGVRIIGKASQIGELKTLDKPRGQEKALTALFKRITEEGYKGGKVYISHCCNFEAAEKLKNIILSVYPKAETLIYKCGGLCSFYAEKGGLLLGFEKN